ncbi:MAG: ABC transporter permease [Acidobacteriota bacterium]
MSFERDMNKEIRFHLEQAVADYVAQGMTLGEARDRARREFGSVELAKDELRDTRALGWLADLGQDVRYAWRGFRKSPGFALTAVAVLGLGIGANTTVFTLLHRVLLAELPVENPEELVELNCTNPLEPEDVGCGFSYPGFQLFSQRTDLLRHAVAFTPARFMNVAYRGVGEVANGQLAGGEVHELLGLLPATGRLLHPSDDQPGAAAVVVLSFAYWQRRFGADEHIVGQTVEINARPVVVVGVTPPAFRGLGLDHAVDLTIPLSMTDAIEVPGHLKARDDWWLRIVGRRAPGVSVAQVQAGLAPVYSDTVEDIIQALGPEIPSTLRDSLHKFQFFVAPAASGAVSEMRYRLDRPLRILMGAVVLVFLLACANLAGLVAARSASRRREFGVRLALGAGRARILRELLAESFLLALLGAVAGLALAVFGSDLMLRMAAGDEGLRAIDAHIDAVALGFTAAVSVVAMVLIGILPALWLASTDPQTALRGVRSSPAKARLIRGLIPAQVGLAVVLLMGAALFLRTFENLRHIDLGYRSAELLQFRVSPGLVNYDAAARRAYYQRMTAGLEALPGVAAVTMSQNPVGNVSNRTGVILAGFEARDFNAQLVSRNFVGARYVETSGLRLIRGRDLTASDQAPLKASARATKRSVSVQSNPAVVNESFARHFFGSLDILGRQFSTGDELVSVVGVVADARERGPRVAPERTLYVAVGKEPAWTYFTLRVRIQAAALIPAVRSVAARVDRAVPVQEMETASEFVEGRLGRERLLGVLSTAFAMLALLLVGVGIYGLIAGAAASRTRELGIRVALGAKPAAVAWLVTRESVMLVAAGAAIGLGLGLYLGRFIESQLFEVKGTDPAAYVVAALALVVCAGSAAYVPARRAAGANPMQALRVD